MKGSCFEFLASDASIVSCHCAITCVFFASLSVLFASASACLFVGSFVCSPIPQVYLVLPQSYSAVVLLLRRIQF